MSVYPGVSTYRRSPISKSRGLLSRNLLSFGFGIKLALTCAAWFACFDRWMSCRWFSKLSWARVLTCAGLPRNTELSEKINLSCPGGILGHFLGKGMTEYSCHMIAVKTTMRAFDVVKLQVLVMHTWPWISSDGPSLWFNDICNTPSGSGHDGHSKAKKNGEWVGWSV